MDGIKAAILWCFLLGFINAGNSESACSSTKWQCKNKECIKKNRVCDGKKDCSDGSDETPEACIHFTCPFGFRCAYGGCVPATAECNRIKDCADNSDEITPNCLPRYIVQQMGNCVSGEFQCTSSINRCIDMKNLCDGKRDCADGTDEIVENCAATVCPANMFRCGYGACILGTERCNGIRNCADGSDETNLLCGTDLETPISSSCQVGTWNNTVVSYAFEQNTIIQPGEFVEEYILIHINCKPGFTLLGKQENRCSGGMWVMQPIPICEKICKTITHGISYDVKCVYKNVTISCYESMRPETEAKFTCKLGYAKPEITVPDDMAVCQYSGNWNYQPYECNPICGILPYTAQPLILGEIINNTYVPWNVVIYEYTQDNQNGTQYKNICGGTIVATRIVISAAHCFWNVKEHKTYDKSKYIVVAGKFYRALEATEHQPTQRFNIQELEIFEHYHDLRGNYEADIAIVILDSHITYDFHIKPVCVDTNIKETERKLEPFTFGLTAGFGLIDAENNTDVLRVAQQMVDNSAKCNVKTGLRYTYISGDKLCVQGTESDAVCQGDSGGGFVVPKSNNNQVEQHFLWGVVSHTAARTTLCTGNSYVAYTNVQTYIGRIKEYILRYKAI